ncbi:MAG: hypothetical protein DDT20_01689 [Firmicutes bacterium]|nr:hypothetical protein [Bacillota bacterium]
MCLALADEVTHGGGRDHNLKDGYTAGSVGAWQELLGNYALQRRSQLNANL